MWHMGYGFGGGWLGMLGMVVIWVIVVAALVLVSRLVWDRAGPPMRKDAPESPLEILQRRYARGEINRAEYEEKRRDLQQ